jgi:UDP-N-acetylmuramoylalanine--D-glutamate ligase
VAAARFCAGRGDEVVLTDRKTDAVRPSELPAGVKLELGTHRAESFLRADVIVVSPGVPPIAELEAARLAGVTVIGELELAAREVRAPIAAITGTNGKSTTTSLAGAICAATGKPTFCGGNLGTPFIEVAGTPAAARGGLCVVEVSSFQLETTVEFRPRVAALLNITPDHLDRYPGMRDYVNAKSRIFENQGAGDYAIVNAADPLTVECAMRSSAQRLLFSSQTRTNVAATLEGPDIVLRVPGARQEERYPLEELQLVGRHNAENAMVAFLAARLLGATPDHVRQVARVFRPLTHRMELVGEARGVRYYDDSKGTNVGAVAASLDGFPRPYILIAGGKHKGGEYTPLQRVLARGCKQLIVIGEAAPLMAAALGGVVETRQADSLERAVEWAAHAAEPGWAVVLSPACSSFDMFRDYEHRAQVYRAAVDKVTQP